MNQLYEKKCDCRQYDEMGDHRSALIKMELPEYEESQYSGTKFVVFRALRLICYFVTIVLLGYCLWRIRIIENTLVAGERFNIAMRTIAADNNPHRDHRVTRSIKNSQSSVDLNSFGFEKELPRGAMLTSKNENPLPPKNKPMNKEEFEYMVNSLFDKIQAMHNDTDRSHFDNNMKAVFQAWFPVFDALLPKEFRERKTEEARKTRSINGDKSSEESSEEKKLKQKRSIDEDMTSEESSEEKKPKQKKMVYEDKPSEEISEEKKLKQTESIEKSDEVTEKDIHDSVEHNHKTDDAETQDVQRNSEESSKEELQRKKRSTEESSEDSSDSSEEPMQKVRFYNKRLDEEALIEQRKRLIMHSIRQKEDIEESSQSSESSESSEKIKDKPKFNFVYHVITTPRYDGIKYGVSSNAY